MVGLIAFVHFEVADYQLGLMGIRLISTRCHEWRRGCSHWVGFKAAQLEGGAAQELHAAARGLEALF